jgi:alkylhydroperoxidase family enzyme
MSSQRIPPLEAPYPPGVVDAFNVIMPPGMAPLNVFRTVGNNERVLTRMVRGGLLDRGSVSIADRELVILRACARCGAEYEWGVHVASFATRAGFNGDQISDTINATVQSVLWDERQRTLIRMVDELHSTSSLSDDLWLELQQHFTAEQLIELIMLAGLYHAVSFLVNGLQIENETFAPHFPGPG